MFKGVVETAINFFKSVSINVKKRWMVMVSSDFLKIQVKIENFLKI